MKIFHAIQSVWISSTRSINTSSSGHLQDIPTPHRKEVQPCSTPACHAYGTFLWRRRQLLEKVSGTDDQWRNPLLRLAEGAVSNPLKINRFIGSYYADITLPLKGLRFRTNLGIDYETRQDYNFQSAEARGNTMNYARNGTENRSMFTWENLLFYDRSFEIIRSAWPYSSRSMNTSGNTTKYRSRGFPLTNCYTTT